MSGCRNATIHDSRFTIHDTSVMLQVGINLLGHDERIHEAVDGNLFDLLFSPFWPTQARAIRSKKGSSEAVASHRHENRQQTSRQEN